MRSIEERLHKIKGEQTGVDTDSIDEQLAVNLHDKEFGKECPVCGREYAKRKQKCKVTGCNNAVLRLSKRPQEDVPETSRKRARYSMTRHEFMPSGCIDTKNIVSRTKNPYEHIHSNHPESPIKIKARDPVFCNPNSYASCITVLRSIGKDLKVQKYDPTSCRKWAVIICDGLPFSLCTKLLKETYTCSVCNAAIFTRKGMASHLADVHDVELQENSELMPEFGWVLLRIGYGHYEMNMVRF